MLPDNPTLRKWIYAISVAAQLLAVVLTQVDASWAGTIQQIANILAGIAGVTAISNVPKAPVSGDGSK